MADAVNLPSGFGGLTRYNEEYDSKIMLSPLHVVVLIVAVIAFRIALNFF